MAKKARSPDDVSDSESSSDTAQPIDFEASLEALEALVEELEGGELSLEASLAAFERGVKLTRECQQALQAAELKVKQLTENNTLEPLDLDPLDDD